MTSRSLQFTFARVRALMAGILCLFLFAGLNNLANGRAGMSQQDGAQPQGQPQGQPPGLPMASAVISNG